MKKRADFLNVTDKGERVVTAGLILQAYFRNDGDDTIRVGFTVSKKVGSAVSRNRVKRRFRSLTDTIIPELGHAHYDYVIVGRKAALNRPYEKLEKDLKYALHHVHQDEDEA